MKRKKYFWFFILGLFVSSSGVICAEWLSIDGAPAKWGDIIQVSLSDLHPTQPGLGFDRLFYKLGRYKRDRRKVFDEVCETNGQKGIRDFTNKSVLMDPKSYTCMQEVGSIRSDMKTVVVGPDGKLYLTDGHHTFNAFWHMDGGGPNLQVYVVMSRDYHDFPSMAGFWEQMKVEKNVWLFDSNDQPITSADLPPSLGLEHFNDDSYRSLMYFTRRIAWMNPGRIGVPDQKFQGDNYPDLPFVEFYWVREIRSIVNLNDYDLSRLSGYVDAIKAVGNAVIEVKSKDVGGSGKSAPEMGQFQFFNLRELTRISRPGTGKLAYMLKFKTSPFAQSLTNKKISN